MPYQAMSHLNETLSRVDELRRVCPFRKDPMIPQPEFLRLPKSCVSGRLVSAGYGENRGVAVPAVLESHVLPGIIGSSVYILAAVGPSTSSWPFFPAGGAVLSDWNEMRRLAIADEAEYYFELDGSGFDWKASEFDFDQIEEAADLIERVLAFGRESLGLMPWDDSLVKDAVEQCQGWDRFDEFMALPEAVFPTAES